MESLKSWSPGWLPTGWKRGDKLQVINPNFRHGSMMRLHNVQPMMTPCFGWDDPVYMQNMEMAEFHYSDRGRVLAWLRCFCFAEDYAELAAQIGRAA